MFESILSNIVMPSASLSLIGFAFGLIIIQIDDWQSTSNTLVFVFTYLLIVMSPNPSQTKKSHTGSRAEQFAIKQPTSCALRRTRERETERKRPRQRKGSQCASADPLSHTEREVQFPLPPTCSALASFRMPLHPEGCSGYSNTAAHCKSRLIIFTSIPFLFVLPFVWFEPLWRRSIYLDVVCHKTYVSCCPYLNQTQSKNIRCSSQKWIFTFQIKG